MTTVQAWPAISVTGLAKSFGDKVVLDSIDLTVPDGTIFALLSPTGAGKTTVVQILSTLIAAERGEIQIAGHDLTGDPDAVRAAIGVTGQRAGLALLAFVWAGRLYGNREQLVR